MSRVKLFAGVSIATVVTLAAGFWTGSRNHRWATPIDLVTLGELLGKIPSELPSWRGVEDYPLEREEQRTLQCAGHSIRRYLALNRVDEVTATILVGPPGPMSLHGPDVCYVGVGFRPVGKNVRKTIQAGDVAVEAWTTRLEPADVSANDIQVLWSWYDGRKWTAPDASRFAFAGQPYLYKLQLVTAGDNEGLAEEVFKRFLAEYLPEVEKQLPRPSNTPSPPDV